jgi:hypothetical protein
MVAWSGLSTGCALTGLLVAAVTSALSAAGLAWAPFEGPLPAGLTGPAMVSEPITLANPMLRAISTQWYRLPWAPGEAVVLRLRPGADDVAAFGFWAGPEEFDLLVRGEGGWERATPAGRERAQDPTVAYFGHDAFRSGGPWSRAASAIVVGGDESSVRLQRVRLWEPACTAMVLERGERELKQARQFLGWAKKPHAEARAAVDSA